MSKPTRPYSSWITRKPAVIGRARISTDELPRFATQFHLPEPVPIWTVLPASSIYQTWQTFSGGFTIGWPALQEKAAPNSGMFTTTPLIRYSGGECGSVCARTR